MALSDIFRASKIKAENEDLKKLLTPEMQEASDMQQHIRDLNSRL